MTLYMVQRCLFDHLRRLEAAGDGPRPEIVTEGYALTDEEKAAIGEGHSRFLDELQRSGELITTQALVDPSQAAVVSVRNGQPVVTDGPFLEAKEFLGGFYLIDCESKQRAIELATQIPDTTIEGLGVEVRQVMFSAGPLEA
jgi:hypothetical protein